MRKRDAVHRVALERDGKGAADGIDERAFAEDLTNGEFADGKNELGFEEPDFAFEPLAAGGDLVGRGHPVAAFGAFTGKAAAHGGEIDAIACLVLGPPERMVEPLEKRLAGGPGERAAELGLLVAGSLADEQDFACDRTAVNHRTDHPRATLARTEGGEMFFESGGGR